MRPSRRARRQPTMARAHAPMAHARTSSEFLRLVSWYQNVNEPDGRLAGHLRGFLAQHPLRLVVEDLVGLVVVALPHGPGFACQPLEVLVALVLGDGVRRLLQA